MSNLILNINVNIEDARQKKMEFVKSVDIRGECRRNSWRHGLDYTFATICSANTDTLPFVVNVCSAVFLQQHSSVSKQKTFDRLLGANLSALAPNLPKTLTVGDACRFLLFKWVGGREVSCRCHLRTLCCRSGDGLAAPEYRIW